MPRGILHIRAADGAHDISLDGGTRRDADPPQQSSEIIPEWNDVVDDPQGTVPETAEETVSRAVPFDMWTIENMITRISAPERFLPALPVPWSTQ